MTPGQREVAFVWVPLLVAGSVVAWWIWVALQDRAERREDEARKQRIGRIGGVR